MQRKITRRELLKLAGLSGMAVGLAACAPTTPEVIKETVEVTKIVEKAVKETVVVEKEKVVEATVVVTPPPEQAKLIFSRWSDPAATSGMNRMSQLFMEEHPEVEVEVWMTGWDEYFTKIETGIAAGNAPDVFRHDWLRVARYAFRGITLPLDPFIQADNWPIDSVFSISLNPWRWHPGTITTGEGTIWALPDDNFPIACFINKTRFDEAGLEYPKKGWTWDDFIQIAKKLTKDTNGDGEPEQWGTYVINYMEWLQRSWPLWQAGGSWYNKDATKATCGTAEFLEAMHWVCDKVLVHKIAPVPSPQQVPPFMSGLAAMTFDGLWMLTTFSKEIKDFEWDITYAPCNSRTGSCTSGMDVDGWSIASSTKYRGAAWELVKFIVGEKGQRIFVEETQWPPCTKAGMEIWMNLPAPPESRQVVPDLIQDQHGPWTIFGGEEYINEVATPALDRVLLGEITVEQGAATMQEGLQKAIDEAWGIVGSL